MSVNAPNAQEERIIVRGSPEYEDYLQHQFGGIKEWVKGVETKLAVSSRVLLLVYVIYITAKSSVQYFLPDIPWLFYTLLGVDVIFLIIQSMGLEGARPGLIHLAQEMEANGKQEAADKLMRSSDIVLRLMVATAIDIVLQGVYAKMKTFGGFDFFWLVEGYTWILLVIRVWSVGRYLGEMAKLSRKEPKIISKVEAEKLKKEKEQKEIRIDNTTIRGEVDNRIEQFARPMLNASLTVFHTKMQTTFDQFAEMRSSIMAELEAVKLASGQSLQMAEINRLSQSINVRLSEAIESLQMTMMQEQNTRLTELTQWAESVVSEATQATQQVSVEALQPVVEAIVEPMLSRLNSNLRQSFESLQLGVRQQVEASVASHLSTYRGKAAEASSGGPSRPRPARLLPHQDNASDAAQQAASRLLSDGGPTRDEIVAMIDENQDRVLLSDAALALAVGGTKSTAGRAKAEWKRLHPNAPQLTDSGEMPAVREA